MRLPYALLGALVAATAAGHITLARQGPLPSAPILFVTQVPTPADFATIGSVFANHKGAISDAPRGGDLWIRYPGGTLKNLTAAAGYGMAGMQGAAAIAVREPSVHWDGTKAVFSMVVGAPTRQYEVATYYWQLYEVTGLNQNQTPVITKVPNQPANYNNVSPIYGADDRIIFSSDRTRDGQRHLYPQLDEYESTPVVSGLWSLDPATGDLFLLNHSPSGVFSPQVDSFGRVIFTRWDHLQRDQQADADAAGGGTYGTFNYASEAAGAAALNSRAEVFPEPRIAAGTVEAYTLNQFFPWQINDDGTGEETLNHIGRHELSRYFNRSFNNDTRLLEFNPGARFNTNSITNFLQIKEAPSQAGTYIGIDAPEFTTHAAGQIISINGAPSVNPDQMAITYVTHPDTASTDDTPSASHSGLYRNPLPMADGLLVAAHTSETRADRNDGTRALPQSRYHFRLKTIAQAGQYWLPGQALTGAGIVKSISYWDPDVLVSYTGELWELDPVEVRSRPRPPRRSTLLQGPEQQVFADEGVDVAALRQYLRANNLALVVSRDVTTRDRADRQQPFRLRVPGGGAESLPGSGAIYDVPFMQFFQGDLIRGMGGPASPRPGRRVLAQPMHDPAVQNPPLATPLQGAVKIGRDGSMAAFVPARRALTWHLTGPTGTPVVRERYWLTFQPGEIRTCTSCHGVNTTDQLNRPEPQNKPEALAELLRFYRTQSPGMGAPTNLQVQSVVGNTVTLQWTAAAAATGYLVEGGTTPGGTMGQIPTGSANTIFSFPSPSGVLYLRVKALGANGAPGAASNEVQVAVNVPTPPDAPTNLTGNAVGSRLQLAWTTAASGGTPTALLLNVAGAMSLTVPLAPGQSFSYPAVPPGTYTLSVAAQNATGTSPASNSVTLTFPGVCTPPGIPTNVRASSAGRRVTVWWDSPASGGAPDAYTLNVTGAFTGSVGTTERSLSGTVGPGTYTLAVVANNACGTSGATPSQTVVVP
jgi:Hydrazine synthase alpha subunit middle domain